MSGLHQAPHPLKPALGDGLRVALPEVTVEQLERKRAVVADGTEVGNHFRQIGDSVANHDAVVVGLRERAALGKFRLDESGRLSGEPLVMVELTGAKVDLDRKMPTRNITPVQQVWNYLNASESAQWAIVCNYAEIRLYSRQKSSNHLHRVFLTELDDPDKFAEFYAIFHADSLLGTGMFAQNVAVHGPNHLHSYSVVLLA